MFKNNSNPGSLENSSLELSRIVDGSDVFNSEVLYKLTKFPTYKLKSHTINTAGLTPSSVSNEIYGSHKYSWILIVFNPDFRVHKYQIGTVLRYPELNDLLNFIQE